MGTYGFFSQISRSVYAFDIQEQALANTKKKIGQVGASTCPADLDGHPACEFNMRLSAAIFNLGYLTSVDKSVITLPATTIEAMEKICALA